MILKKRNTRAEVVQKFLRFKSTRNLRLHGVVIKLCFKTARKLQEKLIRVYVFLKLRQIIYGFVFLCLAISGL